MDVENANCKLRLSEHTDIEILPIERPLKIDREITGLEKLIEELHSIFTYDHVNVQDVQKLMVGYKSNPKEWRKYAKFDRFRYTRNLVDAGNGQFNIMLLCWGPGHASAIHDHADSHCFMKLLSGSLEEVRYDWPENAQPDIVKKLRNSHSNSSYCTNGHLNGESDYQNGENKLQNGHSGCENGLKNGGIEDDTYQNGDVEYEGKSIEEIGRTRLEVNDVCYINDALGLHRMENPSHVDSAVSLHLYCPPFDSCRVFDSRTGKPTQVKVTFWSMYGKKIKRVIEANPVADSQ